MTDCTDDHEAEWADRAARRARRFFYGSLKLCGAMTLYVALETARTHRRCTAGRVADPTRKRAPQWQ